MAKIWHICSVGRRMSRERGPIVGVDAYLSHFCLGAGMGGRRTTGEDSENTYWSPLWSGSGAVLLYLPLHVRRRKSCLSSLSMFECMPSVIECCLLSVGSCRNRAICTLNSTMETGARDQVDTGWDQKKKFPWTASAPSNSLASPSAASSSSSSIVHGQRT